jgi:tRNA threonylcarbamoyladenosine biosynthesis protein TsaE
MAEGWGSLDAVTSPTFVLVNEYRQLDGGLLFHMDAYRLETPREASELDIDRMLVEGALVVEWPERVQEALPAHRLLIQMEYIAEEQRRMQFRADGARYDQLAAKLQRTMFGVA